MAEALDAFRWYTPYPGFTSAKPFAQKLALLRWIRKQKPPLMEEVEGLLAHVGPSRGKALVREVRGGRETLEYITTEELDRLHELRQGSQDGLQLNHVHQEFLHGTVKFSE